MRGIWIIWIPFTTWAIPVVCTAASLLAKGFHENVPEWQAKVKSATHMTHTSPARMLQVATPREARTSVARRCWAFSVVATSLWNALPVKVHQAHTTLLTFRKLIKTLLFQRHFRVSFFCNDHFFKLHSFFCYCFLPVAAILLLFRIHAMPLLETSPSSDMLLDGII